MASQVLTPVSLAVSYADAPFDKLDRIEVYANDNCMAYSVKDKKPMECIRKPCRKSPARSLIALTALQSAGQTV